MDNSDKVVDKLPNNPRGRAVPFVVFENKSKVYIKVRVHHNRRSSRNSATVSK